MKISQKIHTLFLEKITHLSRSELFLNNYTLSDEQQSIYDNFVNRCSQGEPVEYIVQSANFYGREFYIDNRVLIPRDDTETMIDMVREQLTKLSKQPLLIDVGTGSGAIPITLNYYTNPIQTITIDISQKALEVAEKNISLHNFQQNISLLHGNLLEPLDTLPKNHPIIITANLPYIKNADPAVENSTHTYEPHSALYGGEKTGFELYEQLIEQIIPLTQNHTIILYIEIGYDQYEYATNYLQNKSLSYKYSNDSGGIVRCIEIMFETYVG